MAVAAEVERTGSDETTLSKALATAAATVAVSVRYEHTSPNSDSSASHLRKISRTQTPPAGTEAIGAETPPEHQHFRRVCH
ncbi:unnamed protein product [Pieris brassicae]|uniref:Uncharacterized protein n=1 Tax=Pieris brassicae TaxID=7116 RepID=A0A9P0XCJ6_PIEBR|nr:unnamed protein product [Pieris brassicae]